MAKSVIDDSIMEDTDTQAEMIKELADKSGIPYTMPKALEATICILTHYMRTGKRLFGEECVIKGDKSAPSAPLCLCGTALIGLINAEPQRLRGAEGALLSFLSSDRS